MPRTQSCLRKPGNAIDQGADKGNSKRTAQRIQVLDDLLLQDMLSQTLMRPQGDPLLQEKWRGDPCGEGRVPQLGLLRRKQNLPHQVGKPAQSPMLTCQVRLSNIGNKEIQTSGGLVLGSPPVSEKRPLLGPSEHLSKHNPVICNLHCPESLGADLHASCNRCG